MERDDLESIECILSWRNVKARSIGVSKTDQELLRMHEKVDHSVLKSERKYNFKGSRILFLITHPWERYPKQNN